MVNTDLRDDLAVVAATGDLWGRVIHSGLLLFDEEAKAERLGERREGAVKIDIFPVTMGGL